jgi:hypothetical protein
MTRRTTRAEYPMLVLGANSVKNCTSDGSVLARETGNEDCVRRAPATAPIERPPNRPTSNTTAR